MFFPRHRLAFVALALCLLLAAPARAVRDENQWQRVASPAGTLFEVMGLTGIERERVLELLKAGANVNVLDHRGLTPLHYAALWGDWDLVRLLARKGAWVKDAHTAAALDDVGQLLDFLAQGEALNQPDYFRNTPLHWAALASARQCAEALLQRGAKPGEKNDQGHTPLMLAARAGDEAITTLLLQKKASLIAQDMDGNTPLHHAVQGKSLPVVRALLAAGASPATANRRQQTPLALAQKLGLKDIAAALATPAPKPGKTSSGKKGGSGKKTPTKPPGG